MNTTAVFVSIVLGVATIYIVIKPLLLQKSDSYFLEEAEDLVEREKHSVLTTLAEIELDYQMGKMTDEDYNFLQQKYKKKAVDVLHLEEARLDDDLNQVVEDDLQEELEKELETFRMKLKQAELRVRG